MAAQAATFAILAICAVAVLVPNASGMSMAVAKQQSGMTNSTNSTSQSLQISLALEATLTISPPDVAAAIQKLIDNAEALEQMKMAALAAIANKTASAVENLVAFLQQLEAEIAADVTELSADLKADLTAAIDKIQDFIAGAQDKIQAAIECLQRRVEAVTQKLEDVLKNITQAVAKLPSILNKGALDLIQRVNATLHSQQVQEALQKVVAGLKDGVVTVSAVLKGIANVLVNTGYVVLGGVYSALVTVLGALGGVVAMLLNTQISLGVSLG